MTAIKDISTEELIDDLAETITDILVCEVALLRGIESYGENNSTSYRLSANMQIKKIIEDELAARGDA